MPAQCRLAGQAEKPVIHDGVQRIEQRRPSEIQFPQKVTNRIVDPRYRRTESSVYEFFFQEDGGPEARAFIDASIEQSAVTQREDIAICESVQRGLHSSSYDRGRYAPQVEVGEYHFHRLLAERLTVPPID